MKAKSILITGGSKGIGLEAVRRFRAAGWQVITCARNLDTWNKAVNNYPELGDVDFYQTDLANRDEIESLFKNIKDKYTKLDAAVNNASPKIVSSGAFKDVEIEGLYSTLNVDLFSYAVCLKYELNLVRNGGSIVNVTSVNGFRPVANYAMYGAAKHGLEGLTKSLALEAIGSGIRINSVAPGVTWTARWDERSNGEPGLRDQVEARIPIGRCAETAEIVNAIEWLCSDKAAYVVGHTLVVDGGLSLT